MTQHGVEVGAGLADAVLAGGGDLAPEVHAVGQVLDLAAVAGLGARGPGLDGAEERDLVQPAEAARLREGTEAQQAEVVPAALHHRDVQVAAERPGQERDVLADELLLQVLGAGGDDHAPPQLHRGQQVGEGLAGARPGLRQQHAAVAQHPADGVREPRLRRALLVRGQDARQRPARAEEVAGGGGDPGTNR